VPRTVGGDGAVHVCEHVACKLPSENWYEAGKGGQGGRQGGGGGGGRAGPAPRQR
jgi:hypothetical protein